MERSIDDIIKNNAEVKELWDYAKQANDDGHSADIAANTHMISVEGCLKMILSNANAVMQEATEKLEQVHTGKIVGVKWLDEITPREAATQIRGLQLYIESLNSTVSDLALLNDERVPLLIPE